MPVQPTPPGSGPGIYPGVGTLERIIQAIERAIQQVVNAANAYIKHAASTLGRIPGAGAAVVAALDQFAHLVEQFDSQVKETLVQSHAITFMWQAETIWFDIGWKAGTVSQEINRINQWSGDWQGIAGPPYASGCQNQYAAIQAYEAKAKAMAHACDDAATNVLHFYGSVLGIVVGLVAGLLAGGGFGAVIGAVAGAIATLAYAIYELVTANNSTARTFTKDILAPEGAFGLSPGVSPIGGWPQTYKPVAPQPYGH